MADLTELDIATDATISTKICELLEAAQPVPKKSHHSQKTTDEADVKMTDPESTDGCGDDESISIAAGLQPMYLAMFGPGASCDDCGRVFNVEETVFRKIGVTFTTCCDMCHQPRVVAGDCILAHKEAPITTIRPHRDTRGGSRDEAARVRVRVMSCLQFYHEEQEFRLLTRDCVWAQPRG